MTLENRFDFGISKNNSINNAKEPIPKQEKTNEDVELKRVPTTETPWQQYRKLIESGQPIPNWPSDDMPSGMSGGRMEGGIPTDKE